ncbi:MAG: fasciclin domain-containing protein [Actinobacteria bacterium]|nr:fasciclin domain-containing protein [Actinomycetota bacterium]
MPSNIIATVGALVGVSLAAIGCAPAGAARPAPAAGHTGASQVTAMTGHARPSHGPRTAQPGHKLRHGKRTRIPGADQTFGHGCRRLLRNSPVSPAELAGMPLRMALQRIPQLSVLSNAIQSTALTNKLDSTQPLTVFAPDNAAFAYIGAGSLRALLATKADLARVLTFQLVHRRVIPAELARHRVLKTLGGTKIYPAGSGSSLSVNNAFVVCGNLRTADASIYIVNRLVIPSR